MITETCQYMTFKLGDELFAINVSQVREVLEVTHITRVPTAPDYMRGVVNVRGKAIPVVDLRLRFGLPKVTDTVHSRIVVMELELDGELIVLGGIAAKYADWRADPHRNWRPLARNDVRRRLARAQSPSRLFIDTDKT